MKKLLLLTLSLIGLNACAAPPESSVRQPNVIVILADDAGYADFGFQGSRDMQTPNIDRLAASGRIYNQAYVTTPFCSPSRAGLLAGRYTQRFGYEFNLTHRPPKGVDDTYMGLDVEEKTIGDRMRQQGYQTIAVGKWHVGDYAQFHPNVRGFDEFYGFVGGQAPYHPQDSKKQGKSAIEHNGKLLTPKAYLTDDFSRVAVDYIAQNKDQPFFLYLAYNAVHTPMDVLQADMDRFAHIKDPQRQRLAGMTWALDRGVGQVMAALKDNGIDDNTLVIFTNDNGGDKVGLAADNAPLRGTKGTLLEGGIRVPFVASWPGVIEPGSASEQVISLFDILPTALDAAGVKKLPQALDGQSLLAETEQQRALFWRYDNMAAARSGPWKLLRFPDRPAQLYNLATDPGETRDLASEQQETLRALMKDLFAWEGQMIHPRWNTGPYWSQEDVRRYSAEHVKARNKKARKPIGGQIR
ncbi:sulfatase [Porticoccus sp. GXU_MW_L64]